MSEKPDRGRPIRDAEDAHAILAAILDSGQTLAEYCAAHGINRWSLYYWRSKLTRQRLNKTAPKKKTQKKSQAKAATLPVFAEVQLPATATRYEVRAPSGWAVHLDDAFDPHRLALLLEVVARC